MPAPALRRLIALRAVRTYAGSQEGQQAVEAVRTGFMLKKKKGTIGGVGSNWKRRWVEVRQNGTVRCGAASHRTRGGCGGCGGCCCGGCCGGGGGRCGGCSS